jgi:hypothetical protein
MVEPVFFNTTELLNLSFISDGIVDSVYYALIGDGLFGVESLSQLQGLLGHALITNSWSTNVSPNASQSVFKYYVNPRTISNISEISIVIFAFLTSGVLLMCLVMLATPKKCS